MAVLEVTSLNFYGRQVRIVRLQRLDESRVEPGNLVYFSFEDVCAIMEIEPAKARALLAESASPSNPYTDCSNDYIEVDVMSPTGTAYTLGVIPTVDIITLAEMADSTRGRILRDWLYPNVFAKR